MFFLLLAREPRPDEVGIIPLRGSAIISEPVSFVYDKYTTFMSDSKYHFLYFTAKLSRPIPVIRNALSFVKKTWYDRRMLKLIRYAPQFDSALEAVDREMFIEIKYHKDVLRDSILLAQRSSNEGSEITGFGYLLASASFRLIQTELSEYYIHAIQKAVGEEEAEASVMLLNGLMDLFEEQKKAFPGKHLIHRVWARETALAYLSLLKEFGFYRGNTMYICENRLAETEDRLTLPQIFSKAQKNLPGLTLQKVTPDDAFFREYISVNAEAFHIPDSLDDLYFKLRYYDASIYGAFLKDRLIASVSSWRVNDSVYTTENIFCLPSCQNLGATRALLGFVLTRLKKENRDIAALSVYKDDLPAIRLYSSYGYTRRHTLLEMHFT